MRAIALLSGDQAIGQARPALGLSDEIWSGLYEIIMGEPALFILARVWRHQYGAEADHVLAVAEIPALLDELDALRRRHGAALAEPEVGAFFERLTELCRNAERTQARLAFIAD
jgi:hypothetical protein